MFLCASVLLASHGLTFAQGIKFLSTDFDKLIAEAKKQNKLAFIEVYLTGCNHCEALAPVLEEKKVGDFYNQQFVSMKIEANSALAKSMQEKQKLYFPEFPLLFYYDAHGNLLHQTTPLHHPTREQNIEEVIKKAKEAQSPSTSTSGYPARFAAGDRDPIYLIDYGKFTKTIRDTTQLYLINEELAKIFKDPINLESPTGFYVLSRLINDLQNPMAQYFFAHLDTYKTKHGLKPTQQTGEGILYQTLYGQRGSSLTSTEVIAIRKAMVSLGNPANVADSRTILKELEAYFREKATEAATSRFDQYQTANQIGLTDYAYLVRYFNENASSNTYAEKLVQWVNKALKGLQPADLNKAEVAELYREQSEAYRRMGKAIEGKKAAETALTIAKKAGEKTDSFEIQLGKF